MSGQLRPPMRRPSAQLGGMLLALLLIALGVVCIQSLIAALGWISGPSWLIRTAEGVDGLRSATWAMPAAVGCLLVGLLLVWLALRPRRRTHLSLGDDGQVWMTRSALAALVEDAADRVNDVVRVRAEPTRRGVRVAATATSPDSTQAAIDSAIKARLDGTDLYRYVRVSVKEER